jgi:transcriptional regulator with XRE-family HTH domain
VGLAVGRLRRKLGLTQASLAQKTGLHRTYITSVESGKRNLTLTTMAKIAEALDVDTAEFFK